MQQGPFAPRALPRFLAITEQSAPTRRIGTFGLAVLVLFLVLVYAGNLSGPPPPSVTAIAWLGQAQWLLVAWAYWVDGHRASLRP